MPLQRLFEAAFPDFIAGLGVALVCWACAASSNSITRAIIRWRTSKFPKGPDAERATEELLAIVAELGVLDLLILASQLVVRSGALEREISIRTAERLGHQHSELA